VQSPPQGNPHRRILWSRSLLVLHDVVSLRFARHPTAESQFRKNISRS
jgi:hypothetical protein